MYIPICPQAIGLPGRAGGIQASGLTMVLSCLAAMAVCGVFGIFSGSIITRFGIQPFIVTLGLMQIARGLAYLISRGQPIRQIPDSFVWLGRDAEPLLSVPYGVILMVLIYVAARYLIDRGVDPRKTLQEHASYDTIGNAYLARVIHTDPRRWRRLLIVTSEFHLKRTYEIFKWVFKLDSPQPPYEIEFASVTDEGIDSQILRPRIKKEEASLVNLLKLEKRITTLRHLSWDWFSALL